MYMILKNPTLIKAFLFMAKLLKNKMCRRIKMMLHGARMDATPQNFYETLDKQYGTTFNEDMKKGNALSFNNAARMTGAVFDPFGLSHQMYSQGGFNLARKWLPTDLTAGAIATGLQAYMIPVGKDAIKSCIVGVQMLMNCSQLQSVPFVGPALNLLFVIAIVSAEDAFESMTEINFLSTTVEDVYKTFNIFDCVAAENPVSVRINTGVWAALGYRDEFKVYDLSKYYVEVKLTKKFVNLSGSNYKAKFINHGNAFETLKMCGGTGTFCHENGTRYSDPKHNTKISAVPENIDLLYILLADGVLTLDQIEPPYLHFPIGHWTRSAERRRADAERSRLSDQPYKAVNEKPPFDLYAYSPSGGSDVNFSDLFAVATETKSPPMNFVETYESFKHDFSSQAIVEKSHRKLSQLRIKNYDGSGPVFRMTSGGKLEFVQSNFEFKTAKDYALEKKEADEKRKEQNAKEYQQSRDADPTFYENQPENAGRIVEDTAVAADKKKGLLWGGGARETLALRKLGGNATMKLRRDTSQSTHYGFDV
jgi:hypothetical protein